MSQKMKLNIRQRPLLGFILFLLYSGFIFCDIVAYSAADQEIRQSSVLYRIPGGGIVALIQSRKEAR